MEITSVLLAMAIVGGTGIIIGVLLGIAGERFAVETNELEAAVRECLPGNNCGACGYPGCDGLAAAIAKRTAPVNACPVGGDKTAQAIGKLLGVKAETSTKMTAFVRCAGTCEQAKTLYQYVGAEDCRLAVHHPGAGPKACDYGCIGFGTCKQACPFGAIEMRDGIAHVNAALCRACGKCVAECPKHLITMIPADAEYAVRCSSKERGVDVKKVCAAGCIGCGLCAKVCPEAAITVDHFLAHIDQDKCVRCGLCAGKCPVGVIGTE